MSLFAQIIGVAGCALFVSFIAAILWVWSEDREQARRAREGSHRRGDRDIKPDITPALERDRWGN